MKTETNTRTARKPRTDQLQRHEQAARHADRARLANQRERIEMQLDAEEFGVPVRKWF